jgi:hypothetical protein
MTDVLDKPVALSYNNGKLFPQNGIFSSYFVLATSLFCFIKGAWFVGLPLLILSSFVLLSNQGVRIQNDGSHFIEFTNYFGFIKHNKSFQTNDWTYITVLSGKATTTMFSRSTNYTNQTNYFYQICLLNKRYGQKKELIKQSSKSEAAATAKLLAHIMQLTYFEYDPAVIRAAYRQKL